MAKRNVSTPPSNYCFSSKGMELLESFYALPGEEQDAILAESAPHLVEENRRLREEGLWRSKITIQSSNEKTIEETGSRQPRAELILLDFHPYDVMEDLDRLRRLAESGEINGLIFAAKYTNAGERRHFFGASGGLAVNQAEAIGAAALLQNKMLTEFFG